LAEYGARVAGVVLDVTDRAACFAVVEETIRTRSSIDILVNSAGAYRSAKFLDYKIEDFQHLIEVNLYGTIHMMQGVLPHMVRRSSGRVINIASTAGKWGSMNQSAYNVAKHGVVGLTRCVALETAATGVTVNAVCPGITATKMVDGLWKGQAAALAISAAEAQTRVLQRQPIGRMLQPKEIASIVKYLATPEAGGMTGQSILYDGGMLLV
jgi:NAD(P)-dependent dehydrogenase (short-subunit alcohol dehydrogenase family)